MIEIKDGVYFSRFFFVDAKSRNTMGALMRETPDGPFVLRFRYRHYADGKVHDSEDERSWWSVPDLKDETTGLRALENMCEALRIADTIHPDGTKPPDIVVVESDRAAEVMAILGAQPWSSMRAEPLQN